MSGSFDPGRAGDAFVRALFKQAEAGLELYDADLRVVKANPTSLAMRGLTEGQVIGASLVDLDAGICVSPTVQKALDTRSTVFNQVVSAYTDSDPGRQHTYTVSGYALRDAADHPAGSAALIHDITAQARRQEGLDLLNTARDRLGNTLDAIQTARDLADVATPDFADAVAVDLVESVLTGDATIGPTTAQLPMRRAAFSGHDGLEGAYPVGSASSFDFPTPYTQVLADLRPRLLHTVPHTSAWLLHDRARAGFIARSGAHSVIVAPLTMHGLIFGVASFYRDTTRPDPFDEEDLSLAEQLAARSSLCLDSARRFTREHTIAATLQRSLLPRKAPAVAAVTAAPCFFPGSHGAHWFDVISLAGCRVALMLGYVPGDDLRASTAMGQLRTAASTLARMDLPPHELMSHLDDAAQNLAREIEADPISLQKGRPPFSANCLCVTYDPITRQCAATAAGHNPPLLTSTEGAVHALDVPRGSPLGQGTPYEQMLIEIPPGSLISLYSHSVARRDGSEGEERFSRLCEAVSDPSASPENVCDAVTYKLLRHIPQDGAAMLVARTESLNPDHVATWVFDPEPPSISKARKKAVERLEFWGIDDLAPATELIVSELATNVITHAEGPIQLRLIFEQTLTVEVSDESDTVPHLRHARVQDEGGRGIFLVASLSRDWGTRYGASGKTIWAEQDTHI